MLRCIPHAGRHGVVLIAAGMLAGMHAGRAEEVSVPFTRFPLETELADGRLFYVEHQYQPIAERFLPHPNLKTDPYINRTGVDALPMLLAVDVGHIRKVLAKLRGLDLDDPESRRKAFLDENYRYAEAQLWRISVDGKTRFAWKCGRRDTNAYGSAWFHGLLPGPHAASFTVWTEEGHVFEGSFSFTVGPKALDEAGLTRNLKDLERTRQAAHRENADFNAWNAHVLKLADTAKRALESGGKQYSEIEDIADEWRHAIESLWKSPQPVGWRPSGTNVTWESWRDGRLRGEAKAYMEWLSAIPDPDAHAAALKAARGVDLVDQTGSAKPLLLIAQVEFSLTGDAERARQLFEEWVLGGEAVAQQNAAAGKIFGSRFSPKREEWPRQLVPVAMLAPDPLPVAEAPPPAEEDEPEPEREKPDPNARKAIADFDESLRQFEESAQRMLLQIQLYTLDLEMKRASMRELSRKGADYSDPALRQKVQERISKMREELFVLADKQSDQVGDAASGSAYQARMLRESFDGINFAELEPYAQKRLDALDLRMAMFEIQLALAQGDAEGAIRLARNRRDDYVTSGLSYLMEGMAELQANNPVAALETFRFARQLGKRSPGESFEALERSTEIRILRALQTMATAAAGEVQADFDRWIGERTEDKLASTNATWEEYVWQRVAHRPWYDTIGGLTGVGVAEAEARADEARAAAEDMALTQYGIGVIISLRENHTLAELKSMDEAAFRAALAKRWEREVTTEQAQRMRRAMMRAFGLHDLRVLASGETLGAGDVLSRPLLQRIEADDVWSAVLAGFRTGGTEAARSLVSGWSVFTTFAPSAKLGFGKSGPMSAATAEELLGDVQTLGDWFYASAPVQGALRDMADSPTGRRVLEALAGWHQVSESGFGGRFAAVCTDVAIGQVVAHLNNKYVSEEYSLLVDMIGMFDVFSPAALGKAFGELKVPPDRVARLAQQTRELAATRQRQVESFDHVLAETRQAVRAVESIPVTTRRAPGTPPAPNPEIAQTRRALANMGDVAPGTRARAEQVLTHLERGEMEAAAQAMDDLNRTRNRVAREAAQASDASTRLREAQGNLPAATRQPARGTVQRPSQAVPGADDVRATRRPADLAGAPGPEPDPSRATRKTNPPGEPGAGAAGQHRTAAAEVPSTPPAAGEPPIRFATSPAEPTFAADRALLRGDVDEALAGYQTLKVAMEGNPQALAEIERKIVTARKVAVLKSGVPDVPAAPGGPRLFGDENELDAVRDILAGSAEGRHVKVSEVLGTTPTAAEPHLVIDAGQKPIAVTKKTTNSLGHPEGEAEQLASLLSERLDRPSPRARVETLPNATGGTEDLLVVEMMPPGRRLGDLDPGPEHLLAHKDELAEDIVFSALLGDGDRHFGNFRVADDGRLIPYDYGLADLFPDHNYRDIATVHSLQGDIADVDRQLDALLQQDPHPPAGSAAERQRQKLLKDRQVLENFADYKSLYADMNFASVPPTGSPEFKAYAQALMERHLEHGTRAWHLHGGLLFDAVTDDDVHRLAANLRERLGGPGVVDEIVDRALSPGRDRAYTTEMLKNRLEVLEETLIEFLSRKRLQSRPPAPMAPTRVSCLAFTRSRLAA